MNFSGFLNKVSHALSANVLSLFISILTTLLVPKLIGVEEFGYFQLYIFYTSYIGLLHFGWNDGVLLRLGGSEYAELPRESIFSQFIVLVVQQASAAIAVGLIALIFIPDPNSAFILTMTAICIVISGPMYMLLFILQATLRVKEYARILIIQRLLFGLFVVLISLSPLMSFETLIGADVATRMIALGASLYVCRDVVMLSIHKFFWPRREITANLRAGLPLMLSSMAGSLIIGVVRFGIAQNWSITVFGKVSLALSLSSMVLTAIVAVGQVLFPLLRRASSSRLPKIYSAGRILLSSLTLPALFVYFVLVPVITVWLPDYSESVYYLGIIFPLFIFQVKSSILLEPYLKALRMERTLLWVNLSILLLSVVLTAINVYFIDSLTGILATIVFLVALRSVGLEFFVARAMKTPFVINSLMEILVVVVFLSSLIILGGIWAAIALLGALTFWALINLRDIRHSVNFVRS